MRVLFLLFILVPVVGQAQTVRVMSSVQPLALMLELVAQDRVESSVLLEPAQTPHEFAFTVSDRQRLQRADLVLWVGPGLEPYLTDLLKDRVQLSMHNLQEGSPEAEEHPDHSHSEQHLWLNGEHGASMMWAIAEQLAMLDPVNADFFRENARRESLALRSLASTLVSFRNSINQPRPYAVAHQAYGHFLEYTGLPQPMVLSKSPEIAPGARQLWLAGKSLQAGDCLLVVRGHVRKWMSSFSQRQQLSLVEVDIMGASSEVTDYKQLLNRLTAQFHSCIARQ